MMSGKAPDTSSPARLYSRFTPPDAATCTRMPSHFHSARKCVGSNASSSARSMGLASIGGRKAPPALLLGLGASCSSQSNSGR